MKIDHLLNIAERLMFENILTSEKYNETTETLLTFNKKLVKPYEMSTILIFFKEAFNNNYLGEGDLEHWSYVFGIDLNEEVSKLNSKSSVLCASPRLSRC